MSDRKYAILGDIHSNLEALNVVLEDAEEYGVSDYVCVGDIVGYNADPVPCIERIRGISAATVQGNHDHYCSNTVCLDDFHPLAARVVDWTRSQLSAEHIEYLRNLAYTARVGGFTIVHSTLDMPEKWGYVFDTLEAEANFSYQPTALCFYGHTHLPVVFDKHRGVERRPYRKIMLELGRRYLINVGSVGQPRDGDPRAAYVIYTPRSKEVELRRLEYDIRTTQSKVREAGLPERLARRLELGR